MARREVVEYDRQQASLFQCFAGVAADETGTAGDENTFHATRHASS
jgi:hypothetical protein